METIRFDIELGIQTLKGVLTLGETAIKVEWRRYNAMETPVGPLDSISVDYTDLVSVTVRRRPFKPIIDIAAKAASTFGPIPLPAGDLTKFRAKVAYADRRGAEAWGAEAGLRIAEAIPREELPE